MDSMKKKIVIMGSFVVDLMGRAPHLPEPGETVKGSAFKMGPGGKGSNQAVAAKRAGANVDIISKVGNDVFGELAINNFRQEGFNTEYIFIDTFNQTGTALILVDDTTGENAILVTLGACSNITSDDLDKAKHMIKEADIFVAQLETNISAIEQCIKWAHESGVQVVLNPAPIQEIDNIILAMVDIITPNEVEASKLTGIDINSIEDARKAATLLQDKGAKNVVITLGAKGALVREGEREEIIEPYKVNAIDTTGAGDAFNGGLVTALSENKTIIEAAKFANALAALSVTKIGTAPAMPFREEIERLMNTNI
ncbi:MAG: ribokinase [Clostridia bacterium BRH_c25]|nr:MAG: ribokinase [Clostridia bacterium BRH_c25]